MKLKFRSNKRGFIALGVIIVIASGVGVWAISHNKPSNTTVNVQKSPSPSPSNSVAAATGADGKATTTESNSTPTTNTPAPNSTATKTSVGVTITNVSVGDTAVTVNAITDRLATGSCNAVMTLSGKTVTDSAPLNAVTDYSGCKVSIPRTSLEKGTWSMSVELNSTSVSGKSNSQNVEISL